MCEINDTFVCERVTTRSRYQQIVKSRTGWFAWLAQIVVPWNPLSFVSWRFVKGKEIKAFLFFLFSDCPNCNQLATTMNKSSYVKDWTTCWASPVWRNRNWFCTATIQHLNEWIDEPNGEQFICCIISWPSSSLASFAAGDAGQQIGACNQGHLDMDWMRKNRCWPSLTIMVSFHNNEDKIK